MATKPTVGAILRLPGMLRAIICSSLALSSIDALYTYLPAVAEASGWTASAVSGTLVLFGLMAMASRLSLGGVTRAWGRRLTITLACGTSAIALLAMGLSPPAGVVFGLTGVFGFMCGMVQPLTMSWTSLLAPKHGRGTATSLRMLGNRVGQSGIPVASGLVITLLAVPAAFALSCLTMAAAAWCAYRSRYWRGSLTTDTSKPD
jgi:predicted MFS family arabinose efflux permease